MATHYFIDLENVHDEGVKVIKSFSPEETDYVYAFCTQNTKSIDPNEYSAIKSKLEFVSVNAGKQSLDMSLCTVLGMKMGQFGKKDSYIIISKDTDYDSVIEYAKKSGYSKVSRKCTEIKQKSVAKDKQKANEKTELNNKITALMAKEKVDGKDIGKVASIVVKNISVEKNKRKSSVYKSLTQNFGEAKGLKFYNIVKGLIN